MLAIKSDKTIQFKIQTIMDFRVVLVKTHWTYLFGCNTSLCTSCLLWQKQKKKKNSYLLFKLWHNSYQEHKTPINIVNQSYTKDFSKSHHRHKTKALEQNIIKASHILI